MSDPTAARDASITPREREILTLLRAGCSRNEAARELRTPRGTLGWHATQAYRKLGISSLVELLAIDELPPARDRRRDRPHASRPDPRPRVGVCRICGAATRAGARGPVPRLCPDHPDPRRLHTHRPARAPRWPIARAMSRATQDDLATGRAEGAPRKELTDVAAASR